MSATKTPERRGKNKRERSSPPSPPRLTREGSKNSFGSNNSLGSIFEFPQIDEPSTISPISQNIDRPKPLKRSKTAAPQIMSSLMTTVNNYNMEQQRINDLSNNLSTMALGSKKESKTSKSAPAKLNLSSVNSKKSSPALSSSPDNDEGPIFFGGKTGKKTMKAKKVKITKRSKNTKKAKMVKKSKKNN